jgi:hypothetical protein
VVKKDNVPMPYTTVSKLLVETFREGTNPNRESREGRKEVSRGRAQPRRKNERSKTKEDRKFDNEGRSKVWSNTADVGDRQAAYDA